MEFSAKQIAAFLNGEIEGNPDVTVSNVSKIEEGKKGTLSFLANPKYEKYIYETVSSIVLVNKSFKPERKIQATLIKVDNAYESFAKLLELYAQGKQQKLGISPLSSIDENSKIGKDVYIGEFTVISDKASIGDGARIYPQVYIGENVVVGKNSILYPGVKIYHDCSVGSNCIIHSGCVIGSDGFGFAPQEDVYRKIPQVGNVIIGDDVEIGANVTIDRATMGSTIIRNGAKLDNLIQIAHNVEIGENTVIVAQAGIAGSTKIGKNVTIAAQAGLVGHITVADRVIVAAQAGVGHNLKNEGEVVLGSPAFKINEYKRSSAVFKRLPELRNTVIELQKEVEEIKKRLNS